MFHGGGGHHGGGGRGGGGFRRGGGFYPYPVVYDTLDDDDSYEVVEVVNVGCEEDVAAANNDPSLSGEVLVRRRRRPRSPFALVG